MEDERLVFLSTSSHGDGVRQQIEKVLEQRSNTFNAILRQAPTIEDAIALLNDGVGDLVAMSPENWNQYLNDNLVIVGLLSRREPTWVLVSDDKPEYLIKHARVVCQHPLIQRQMLRLRQDLNLLEKEDVDVRLEVDSREEIERLEELRLNGAIDGYVVKRSQYNLLSGKARRHTLGLQKGSPERSHFVPPPLNGFTLIVGRVGFPKKRVEHILDPSAEFAYRIESALLDSIPSDLVELTGIHVEQRGVGTILREAKRNNDDWTMSAMIDTEKKVRESGTRVEMIIETLSVDGKVSACAEQVGPIEKHRIAMVNLLQEWGSVLTTLTSEHQATNRKIRNMPDEFHEERPAMMRIHSDESE
ncbi:MAG: hypothetical protein VXY35_02215 [Candidatus Thermoplasmatota archaeon]|jgi:hypothetical protein|nr:hypothetical protein [Candidatus Thermoplasmatota archaeon]